jgi:3-methyladenine DNA glycosylase AlkC
MTRWACDANVHVRRLASEGLRPRLPWAKKLDMFIADPLPVLELLELLKTDS